jgi:hypothetical protein
VAVRVSGGHRSVMSSGGQRGVGAAPGPSLDLDEPVALPRRSPVPLVVGGALVLGLVGGGAWFALSGKAPAEAPAPAVVRLPDPPAPPPQAAAVTPPPAGAVAVTPPAAVPGPRPAPAAAPVAAAKPAPAPAAQVAAAEKVSRRVSSEPPHAEVFEGEASLGTAPLSLSEARGRELLLTFRLKGYKPATRRVAFESGQELKVTLEKEPAAPVRRPAPGPKKDLADNPYGQESDLKDLP